MRKEIEELIAFDKMPCSEADFGSIETFEKHLSNVKSPISSEEALALKSLFIGEDDCYGLSWTLLHLIETAPIETIEKISREEGFWFRIIRERFSNSILRT